MELYKVGVSCPLFWLSKCCDIWRNIGSCFSVVMMLLGGGTHTRLRWLEESPQVFVGIPMAVLDPHYLRWGSIKDLTCTLRSARHMLSVISGTLLGVIFVQSSQRSDLISQNPTFQYFPENLIINAQRRDKYKLNKIQSSAVGLFVWWFEVSDKNTSGNLRHCLSFSCHETQISQVSLN